MKHRQFKVKCKCTVIINDIKITKKNLQSIKKTIYEKGQRGKWYYVIVQDNTKDTIYDVYIFKYTKDGPIFTKQVYSKWKEDKMITESRQYNIFIKE